LRVILWLRLLGAIVFVFGGVRVAHYLFSPAFRSIPQLSVVLMLTFVALLYLAVRIFAPFSGPKTLGEPKRTRYDVRRAMRLTGSDDYFLELADGSVLYLGGLYLQEAQAFPCRELTVQRHPVEGYVIDVECAGELIVPEPGKRFAENDDIPVDGHLVAGLTFDALRARRTER
jgi:hypothetical protein